ncbi:MAG: DHHA1 domain-containing protein [Treponema sp.]|nr:DHHA1 domain-containing protein [Treponema sp.]
MFDEVLALFDRHQSFILTTHDPPDADGLGAELIFASIFKKTGKTFKIINASPVPALFRFMDASGLIEYWDDKKHNELPEQSAMIVVDTSDEYHTGGMKDIMKRTQEVFTFDHHEPKRHAMLAGLIEPGAASTCELAVELASALGVDFDPPTAMAAYSGIVYDSGFFAYSKTSLRTFRAAIKMLESGADSHFVYKQLNENLSSSALLLQKQAFSTLELHSGGRIVSQVLRKKDLEKLGANLEDAESFVNLPLRAKEVEVSVVIKETAAGEIRVSLRSKGRVNVSKIAQGFGGGGHVAAAGFKSSLSLDETMKKLLEHLETYLDTNT